MGSRRILDRFALFAEVLRPEEFAAALSVLRTNRNDWKNEIRYSEYFWGDEARKTREAAFMVKASTLEEQAAGLRHLLQTGQTQLLTRLHIVVPTYTREMRTTPPTGPVPLVVAQQYRVLVPKLGYRITFVNGAVVIGKAE